MEKKDNRIVPPPLRCFKNGYSNGNVEEVITDSPSIQSSEGTIYTCDHLKEIVDTQDFRDFLMTRYPREILLASLAFGYVNGCIDISTVAAMVGKTDEYVIEHIKVLLTEYKEDINNRLDNAISRPIQKHLA